MKEGGEKLSEEDKQTLQSAIDEAKKELETEDDDKIKAAYETLTNAVQPVFAKMYQQAGGAQGANPEAGAAGDEEFHQ